MKYSAVIRPELIVLRIPPEVSSNGGNGRGVLYEQIGQGLERLAVMAHVQSLAGVVGVKPQLSLNGFCRRGDIGRTFQ